VRFSDCAGCRFEHKKAPLIFIFLKLSFGTHYVVELEPTFSQDDEQSGSPFLSSGREIVQIWRIFE
jgi:hypothetical protein